MDEQTSTNTCKPSHIAEAVFSSIEGPVTKIQDGDVEYGLELVADDHDESTVSVTAWTTDADGDDRELGVFRLTVEQVI
jgi:hypothetical protein